MSLAEDMTTSTPAVMRLLEGGEGGGVHDVQLARCRAGCGATGGARSTSLPSATTASSAFTAASALTSALTSSSTRSVLLTRILEGSVSERHVE